MLYMESFSIAEMSRVFSLTYLNLFEGIFIIFGQWVIHDNRVRQEYHRAVGEAIDDIVRRIHMEKLTLEIGAQYAHEMRNRFFHMMRHNTSPIGLLIAYSIHASTRPYQYYLEKKSLATFGKSFKDLNLDKAREVVMSTLISARRPSNAVTDISKKASLFCKSMLMIIALKSLFLASMSKSSRVEVTKLVIFGLILVMVGKLGIFTTWIFMGWSYSDRNKLKHGHQLCL
ncbi:hypothetical protein V8C35DRAFT_305567 [Trichoderma chlorosporum]